jgi:hypothetical protein
MDSDRITITINQITVIPIIYGLREWISRREKIIENYIQITPQNQIDEQWLTQQRLIVEMIREDLYGIEDIQN